MERYTEKHYDGNGYYLICSGNCETLNCGDCGILDKIVDRLAAYETTGLEPEKIEQLKGEVFGLQVDKQELEQYRSLGPIDRLRKLKQADDEGRCVVPLCRVGDTVYTFSQMRDKRILPFIREYEITSIRIKKRSLLYCHEMDGFIKIMKQSDIGKTVFLTREEAEGALEEMKNG